MSQIPSPWSWEINKESKQVRLMSSKLILMDFVRFGLQSAQPRFLDLDSQLMVKADNLSQVISGREHHSKWYQSIKNPIASFIESTPDLLVALEELLEEFQAWVPNPCPSSEKTIRRIQQAKAAIKKARGES